MMNEVQVQHLEIANKIKVNDAGYNGYPTLSEAYLKLIPIDNMSDVAIRSLFIEVKRIIFAKKTKSDIQHWALVS